MTLTQISTAGVKDDAVTAGKIPANAVGSSEIAANAVGSSELADNAVDTAAIANDAVTGSKINANAVGTTQLLDTSVTLAKLEHGTSSNDGKFLRANNGADPSFETIPPAAITAVGSTGANRVITDDGDGTVTAEGSLNFTGDRLLVNTSTPDPYGNRSLTVAAGTSGGNTTTAIEIRSPTNGDGRLIFTDSTSSGDTGSYKGQIMYDQNNDFMQFGVNGASEAMRIDSSGNLGINNTSPTHKLDIDNGTAKINRGNSTGDILILRGLNADRFRFDTDGLKFGTDTAAANALDDYEEGSFTPSLAGYSSISYHRQYGYYTKIGRQVWMHIYFYVYQASGNSSPVTINGLPFTSSNAASGYIQNGGHIWYQNDTFETSFNSDGRPYLYIGSNSNYAQFRNQGGSDIIGNSTALGTGGNNRYIICGLQMIV